MRRVFSLWQPWATLCVAIDPSTGHPPKQYETRAWPPRFGLPIDVVIHATKRWDRGNAWTATDPAFRVALARCGYLAGPAARNPILYPNLRPLPFGSIIGLARVVGFERTEKLRVGDEESIFGDWSIGRYAWRMEQAIELPEPIPFLGRQEPLYVLDQHYERLIDQQFEALANA